MVKKVSNQAGIKQLCELALFIKFNREVNSATTFAIRTLLREAVNKSVKKYKGNINSKNCDYISVRASKARKELVADHALPISVLLSKFYNSNWSLDKTILELKKYNTTVLITKDENSELNKLGLSKKMPADWNGKDKFQRYSSAKIKIKSIKK